MAIIGIVAVDRNFAIGRDGKLPWHYSSDLKFFKNTTSGNAILMGANTWRSIGKPLPKRLNIVLSRTLESIDQPGVLLVKSKEEVTEINKYLGCDLFIIGGAKTYKSFADLIEKWIVTEIPVDAANADAFMPHNFLKGFKTEKTEEIDKDLIVKTFARSK